MNTLERPSSIPIGTTHFCWRNGRTEYIAPIKFLSDLDNFKAGTLDFGKYSYMSDQFRSLLPKPPKIEDGLCRVLMTGALQEAKEAGSIPAPAKAPKAVKAANPKPPRQSESQEHRPGESLRPAPGSKTGQVWEAADELKVKLGRIPTKGEIVAALPAINPGTVGVQFGKWKKENS